MKRSVCIIVFAILFVLPVSGWGQDKMNYIIVKGGLYTFTDAVREATLDTGFNGEIAVGRYLHPNFSVELGTGYFHDGVNKDYGNDIKGMPFIMTAKVLYPFKGIEIFAGGGAGFYLAKFHGKYKDLIFDASDTVFGTHVQAGVNVDVSRNLFVGIEGKYIFTDKADFNILKSSLNGHTATANFGYRF